MRRSVLLKSLCRGCCSVFLFCHNNLFFIFVSCFCHDFWFSSCSRVIMLTRAALIIHTEWKSSALHHSLTTWSDLCVIKKSRTDSIMQCWPAHMLFLCFHTQTVITCAVIRGYRLTHKRNVVNSKLTSSLALKFEVKGTHHKISIT